MNGDRVCVFTFKDGLLSRVAHDLRLHVEHFTITREGDDIVTREGLARLRILAAEPQDGPPEVSGGPCAQGGGRLRPT